MSEKDKAEGQTPSVLGRNKSALRHVAYLARQVLREEGRSEDQIDALLKRRYARDEDRF
jgi:hypothetical protein